MQRVTVSTRWGVRRAILLVFASAALTGCQSGPAISKSRMGNLQINVMASAATMATTAEIYIDDVFVGNATAQRPVLHIRRGARTVRVEHPGFESYERTIQILGDPNHQVLNVQLEPSTGQSTASSRESGGTKAGR